MMTASDIKEEGRNFAGQLNKPSTTYQTDLDRIKRLFNETKDISRRLAAQDSQKDPEQHQLKESLKYIEGQLGKVRDTNVYLSRRFEQAQEEVEKCHDQIARQANHNHLLEI